MTRHVWPVGVQVAHHEAVPRVAVVPPLLPLWPHEAFTGVDRHPQAELVRWWLHVVPNAPDPLLEVPEPLDGEYSEPVPHHRPVQVDATGPLKVPPQNL